MRTIPVLLALAVAAASHAAGPSGGGVVAVSVDATSNVHAFSPDIFGVSFGDADRNAEIGYTVRRWGGNSVTRYNWQNDVHSTAMDWYFENIPGARDRTQIPPIGNSADAFVGESLAAGAKPLMTIPTIGWTPRYDSPLDHPYFAGFSVGRYGAQQSVDPWDTDAGNGRRANGDPLTGNDPHDTSSEADPEFERGWVQHFEATFGNASSGAVTVSSAITLNDGPVIPRLTITTSANVVDGNAAGSDFTVGQLVITAPTGIGSGGGGGSGPSIVVDNERVAATRTEVAALADAARDPVREQALAAATAVVEAVEALARCESALTMVETLGGLALDVTAQSLVPKLLETYLKVKERGLL